MTSLYEILKDADSSKFSELLNNSSPLPVKNALARHKKTPDDLALLLSPGADALLEEMAQQAHTITKARFGNAVNLYAPLYVTNKCTGTCPYCGFKRTEKIKRITLDFNEIIEEAEALRKTGILQVLLVSGTHKDAGVQYLSAITKKLKTIFPSVTIEVPPLNSDDYQTLIEAGVDGVTLYQETYDEIIYDSLHKGSVKGDYNYRLNALERAGNAEMRKLNIGVLWGLAPWRKDALRLGLHAKYLEKSFWKSQVLIGLPRLHHVPVDFTIKHPVSNRDFVHILMAMRIYCHDAGIVVSTREHPDFRDNLLNVGATMFSAGSKTEPGGYTAQNTSGSQFGIDDHRTPDDVKDALLKMGYDPVFKDWDKGFIR